MNIELKDYFQKLDKLKDATEKLPTKLATEAVNFSKERFRQQNWVDTTTQNWKPRKRMKWETKKRSRRAILVDTGRLRGSIRIIYTGRNRIIIGTDVPYARRHNEGYRGEIKQQVKSHNRKTRSGRIVRVRKHERTLHVNIPRRQFIGSSLVLDKRLQRRTTAEFIRALK